jgi:hypothetical protein
VKVWHQGAGSVNTQTNVLPVIAHKLRQPLQRVIIEWQQAGSLI